MPGGSCTRILLLHGQAHSLVMLTTPSWQAALVLPQAGSGLESKLRRLARDPCIEMKTPAGKCHRREIWGGAGAGLPPRPGILQRTNTVTRPLVAGVQPQVFHGGRFGVWGTPPPKPLNCKSKENSFGAFSWRLLDGQPACSISTLVCHFVRQLYVCRCGFGCSCEQQKTLLAAASRVAKDLSLAN